MMGMLQPYLVKLSFCMRSRKTETRSRLDQRRGRKSYDDRRQTELHTSTTERAENKTHANVQYYKATA